MDLGIREIAARLHDLREIILGPGDPVMLILKRRYECWFVGRADDVIKSSGCRIGPFEVESALLEHPAVLECAITAVPDPDRGQVVKATVVPTAGHRPGPELVRELQEHVESATAPYKYPRVIEFVGELPKTIGGKIRRVEIRDRDKDV